MSACDAREESRDLYVSPLARRWAGEEMLRLFSPRRRFATWRRLWVLLAEAEQRLGLAVTPEQVEELRRHVEDINFEAAERYEQDLRHDVMAHVRAYGDQCPSARGIIHLGATSCYVTDNADLILMREGLRLIERALANVVDALARFAERYRDLPTLGFTHFQPAQPTTVGKRATLWAQDFALDLAEVSRLVEEMPFRGVKGATGTQASFLRLFEGDHEKVRRLDAPVAEAAGFRRSIPVSGQTYTRKVDSRVLAVLSGVAQSAHKFANDVRLLQHRREVEEPFGRAQVGSSAMPYKRNPMRCERITGLARFLINLASNADFTAASQWLERTLDDSSNRRLALPEAFLTADAILQTTLDVAQGLVVHEKVVAANLRRELPFLATEAILMEAVKAGGDRQELHERLRRHAHAASERMKEEGAECDLFERIAADPAFAAVHDRLDALMRPEAFVGRAPQQVEEFVGQVIAPLRKRYADLLGMKGQVKV